MHGYASYHITENHPSPAKRCHHTSGPERGEVPLQIGDAHKALHSSVHAYHCYQPVVWIQDGGIGL